MPLICCIYLAHMCMELSVFMKKVVPQNEGHFGTKCMLYIST